MSRAREASEPQIRAADPTASVWLSANAGSGKTKVLIDRVVRLLLQDVPPQRILCLTYTKAAANEMQIRLFDRLGHWAMLDDTALIRALADLGQAAPADPAMLTRARRLFASAIEAPGGLKIQTIHSFCAAMLRRFPLEAGVSPRFAEMDERSAELLRQAVIEDLAMHRPEIVDSVARLSSDDDFSKLSAEIVRYRDAFARPLDRDALLARFGLPGDSTLDDLRREVIRGDEGQWFGPMIEALGGGKAADEKLAASLRQFPLDRPGHADFAALESALLFGEKTKTPFAAKRDSLPTKDLRARLGARCDPLHDLMDRVADARPRRLGLLAAERSLALHGLAQAFLPAYAARKTARGWLDFDDLIFKARDLLTDPGVAQWVLFKLDGGIDHLLVDEAQDTSPAQWQVIDLLSQEFTAGEGARAIARTIFVVGDKKQSIYSFQGADLTAFDRMQEHFRQRFAASRQPLNDLTLSYSFRASETLLQLVDLTFAPHKGGGLGGETRHLAYREALPGRVELWPAIDKNDTAEPGDWHDPVDLPSPQHHEAILAEHIAQEIARLIRTGTRIPTDDQGASKPLSEGDILILVRRRSSLFHHIIRACKSAGLAVAGADRLKLGAEIAVRDLTALLAFLANDEDDLSLATALRSPLFGWGEDALYRLAAGRGRMPLWQALRQRRDEFADSYAVLADLRDQADYLRPFELLDRALGRHDGRRKLLARLGAEAEDGLDTLLEQALGYERLAVPSLIGFLSWLDSDAAEIKRQADETGDKLRVMTVHGAKGLEAPVVILPDTADRRTKAGPPVLRMDDGAAVWNTRKDLAPPQLGVLQAEHDARQEEENTRLLYVAMTRAKVWLITAAAGEVNAPGNWYRQIEAGMRRAGAIPYDHPLGRGLRLDTGSWPSPTADAAPPAGSETVALPEWATRAAPVPQPTAAPLSPSDLGGAKALTGTGPEPPDADVGLEADLEAALRHGRRLHRLLEHLPDRPRSDWPAAARAILAGATAEDATDDAVVTPLLAEAERVLTAPALVEFFAQEALCEVEITAEIDGARLLGAIDRLVIYPDRLLAVDYKSNALVPAQPDEVPAGLLRQIGAYRAALQQIYQDRRIETAILWTKTAELQMLPQDLVEAAFRDAGWP